MFNVPLSLEPTKKEDKLLEAMCHAARRCDFFLLRDLSTDLDKLIGQTPASSLRKRRPRFDAYLGRVLEAATCSGDLDIVVYLLEVKHVGVSLTLIFIAIDSKFWSILKVFVEHGWDINELVGFEQLTILGIYLHDAETVRELLEVGADPTLYNFEDDFDIGSAAGSTGTVEVFKLLREYAVDFTRTNALHAAALENDGTRTPVMAYLLDELGVPIVQLDWAFEEEEVHERDFSWHEGTALHYTTMEKATENLAFLLSRGADRNVKNLRGETALDLARQRNWDEGIRLLEGWPLQTSQR